MARSLNGNLLGKAAATEKADAIKAEDWSRYPDASYWRTGAEWARAEMFRVLKTGYSDRICVIMDKYFWKPENTWMTICLRAEHMLDLVRALKTRQL